MAGNQNNDRQVNQGVTVGTWLLVLAPIAWMVAVVAVVGFGALPQMKLSGWIILGLLVALIVAVVAFVVRCVGLYQGR